MIEKLSGGARAVRSGSVAEEVIATILTAHRVEWIAQQPIGLSIYGHMLKADYYLPEEELIIESKWQSVGGSADEKLPYLVANIRERYPYPTLIVHGGKGWKTGAIEWLRKQTDGKSIVAVLSIEEFMKWCQQRF